MILDNLFQTPLYDIHYTIYKMTDCGDLMKKTVATTNLRDQTYDIIKNMIILREIEPGKKINEEHIAKEIQVTAKGSARFRRRIESDHLQQK